MPSLVWAQVTPDKPLGSENSRVTAIDQFNQKIDGGAIRGSHLFHSFQEFNVNQNHGVYFSNPAGIDSIVSRVTGENSSNILGTLGVLGKADLYLLNPNGIIFGPNAALDIQGSFYASTTNSILLGKPGKFPRINPSSSPLLSVQSNANFLTQAIRHQGSIINRGRLGTGKNLSLVAENLDLEGQLFAGKNLTLHADQLLIRDTPTQPFIAAAKGDVLVQGNQHVDIFALNHPNSGLFSGNEMVLRSPNTVQGDALYFSGGNFTIENTKGALGDLRSPKDPIILSLGDVSFENYEGSSLHILSAGSVKIGTATITAPETGAPGFDVLQETVQLSDGSQLNIDGGQQPTLDVRAGVSAETIVNSDILGFNFESDSFFDPAGVFSVPSLTTQPSSADIEIGDIYITQPNGLVYLTTQYQPNADLTGGDISISGAGQFGYGIDVRGFSGNAAPIVFDARNSINLDVVTLDTRSSTSDAGNIKLLANQDISIFNSDLFLSTFQDGDSGSLDVQAKSIQIEGASTLTTSNRGVGDAGDIKLIADQDVTISDGSFLLLGANNGSAGSVNIKAGKTAELNNSFIYSVIPTESVGRSNNINIDADSISISNQSELVTASFGQGDAGLIDLKARDDLTIQKSQILSIIGAGQGDSKGISLTGRSIAVTDQSQILSTNFSQGNSGLIQLAAKEGIQIDRSNISSTVDGIFGNSDGIDITAQSFTASDNSILSSVLNGRGQAGSIDIEVDEDLQFLSGSQLRAGTFGFGDGGAININVGGDILFDGFLVEDGQVSSRSGIFSVNFAPMAGNKIDRRGGDIALKSQSLTLRNGAQFNTGTFGKGDAGNIKLQLVDNLFLSDGEIFSNSNGLGKGGNISIDVGRAIVLQDVKEVDRNANGVIENREVFTSGILTASNPQLPESDLFTPEDVKAFRGDRSSGSISITANSLTLKDGARLNTSTSTPGNAGQISVDIAKQVNLLNGSEFSSFTAAEGEGGNVQITAREAINLTQAQINTSSSGQAKTSGNGGNVDLQTHSLLLDQGASILTNTASLSKNKAGDVSVIAQERVVLDQDSRIASAVDPGGIGQSGTINLKTRALSVLNGSQIRALLSRSQNNSPGGQGQGGTLSIEANESVNLVGVGKSGESSGLLVLAEKGSSGPAGDITVTTRDFQVRDGAIVAAGTFNDDGVGGDITITAQTFQARNGGQILTNTRGDRRAGSIKLDVADSILIDGIDTHFKQRLEQVQTHLLQQGQLGDLQVNDLVINEGSNSGLFANTSPDSQGDGGNITVDPIITTIQNRGVIAADSRGSGRGGDIKLESGDLFLRDRAEIHANSQGQGDAGSITLNIEDQFISTDSDITTSAEQASGGNIRLRAEQIQLHGDSDIRTNVLGGSGGGGDITLTAASILAFDDSDVLAFADPTQGSGGNITLNTPAFFGENFFGETAVNTALNNLDGNDVVNMNATGQTSGIISIPDVSFIQNNLTDLPENLINTETLLANSCIVRTAKQQGKFIVTGAGGLPARPDDASSSAFSTGTIQAIPNKAIHPEDPAAWEIGDPIIEPQAAYSLKDGRLVLSRDC